MTLKMDGWMDGCCTDEMMDDGQMDGLCEDGWMGWDGMDGWRDACMYVCLYVCLYVCMDGSWTMDHGWMNE